MHRREFLKTALAATALPLLGRAPAAGERAGEIVTVAGSIDPAELGLTLPHEHVLVDFIGADQVTRDRYDGDEVVEVVLPHLQRARALGCRTLVECTPAYLGRDPELLARLASMADLQLLTNTGYYGAAGDRYLPPHAFEESAAQLAARWLREWREGIEATGIRPGFIKIGVDAGPLSEVDRKLVAAAARTHLESGLTIAAHTGDGAAAVEELATLEETGLAGEAWIWVHAQNEPDTSLHHRCAERGAWIEYDGIAHDSVERHVELVAGMRGRGLLPRVLVSHDAGWYHVGEPGGGDFRTYDTLFTEFVPALRAAGFSQREIDQLLIDNPRNAFTVRVRRRG